MRQQFNLELYKQHPDWKVETRDRSHVRIICTDKNTGGQDCIIALVSGGTGLEKTVHYNKYGKCIASGMLCCNKDLFLITPEEELTEFEQYLKSTTNIYVEQGKHMEDCDAKEDAEKLLSLALVQLMKVGYVF